jgi:hypothetical protein
MNDVALQLVLSTKLLFIRKEKKSIKIKIAL